MKAQPYLLFDGRCEEALDFYKATLGAEVGMLMRFKQSPEPERCSPASLEKVMHCAFKVGETTILASDGYCKHQPEFKGFSLSIDVPTAAEADRILAALAEGGQVQMPASETFFAHRFGMVADKFGVSWMVIAEKQMGAAEPSSKPFEISRVFDAPRETVYAALTDPERMKRWWGPKGAKVIASKMDLRPGGIYHYGMEYGGMEMWGRFVYREITPPSRLVFVNSFSDAKGGITRHPMSPTWPRELLSTFTLEDVGGKTRFTVTWQPIDPTEEERATFDAGQASMQQGWGGTMDQLEAYLAKG